MYVFYIPISYIQIFDVTYLKNQVSYFVLNTQSVLSKFKSVYSYTHHVY